MIKDFVAKEEDFEKKFLESETRREKEEEKRRKEEREHELKLFGMLCQAVSPFSVSSFTPQMPQYATRPSASGDGTFTNL